jgi:hypothetical protein
MFQRAPPEVDGFGVITWTPGLIRSVQVLMPLGLPLRVAMETTESVTMPLVGLALQSSATRPALVSRVMSGSRENATRSAFKPDATARLWSPDAPYDWVKVMFLPAGVAWKALMICWYAACGVE